MQIVTDAIYTALIVQIAYLQYSNITIKSCEEQWTELTEIAFANKVWTQCEKTA